MKKHERIAGVFLILVGIYVMVYSMTKLRFGTFFFPDAGFLPFWYGLALTILSAIWVFQNLGTDENPTPFWGKGQWMKPVVAFVLMLGYGWLMDRLGYILSTFAFVIGWQFVVEREKWVKTLLIAVIGTAVMFTLFGHFLKVPLPEGIFSL